MECTSYFRKPSGSVDVAPPEARQKALDKKSCVDPVMSKRPRDETDLPTSSELSTDADEVSSASDSASEGDDEHDAEQHDYESSDNEEAAESQESDDEAEEIEEDDDADHQVCACGSAETSPGNDILLCDGPQCQTARHLQCCQPPLNEVPESSWFCSNICQRAHLQQLKNAGDRIQRVASSQLYGKATLQRHGLAVCHDPRLAAALEERVSGMTAAECASFIGGEDTFAVEGTRPRLTRDVRKDGKSQVCDGTSSLLKACEAAEASEAWSSLGLLNESYKERHWRTIGCGPSGCDRQQDHRDHARMYKSGDVWCCHLRNADGRRERHVMPAPPLVVIVPLSDGGTLDVSPFSHRKIKYDTQSVRVGLAKGDVLVIRADLVHAGSAYRDTNWRLHCDLVAERRPGDGDYGLFGADFDEGAFEEPVKFLREMDVACSASESDLGSA